MDDTNCLADYGLDEEPGHDHSEAVRRVSAQLPEDDILYYISDVFRLL